MNVHQHVLPTITTIIPNVYVLGTQAMNLNIGHTVIPINYQITWSYFVTPIVPSKTNMLPTSTYPMWYNVIPFFVPLDLSLYPTYLTGTKGLDFSIFRNCIGYVFGNVYPIPGQLIVPPTYTPCLVGNQFLTMVQPIASKDRQHVQQPIIAPILTII
jgi:hypothetical protein